MSALASPGPDQEVAERDFSDLMYGIAAFYAGGANVVLQLGLPGVGYGVLESKVDSGKVTKHPVKRARTTFTYVAVAMMGDEKDQALYRRAVNRSHAQVRSTADSPVEYNAFDPKLQQWVAVCLAFGVLDTFDKLGVELDDETADALYEHLALFGTSLQMPRELWPADRAAFWEFWEKGVAELRYDPPVRDYLVGIITQRHLAAPFRLLTLPFVFMSIGYLPEPVRKQLGFGWGPRRQRIFEAVNRATGQVYRRLPIVLRAWPFNMYLADMRRRVRRGKRLV
jgi:uncharacterized protein (DUF2236 family)